MSKFRFTRHSIGICGILLVVVILLSILVSCKLEAQAEAQMPNPYIAALQTTADRVVFRYSTSLDSSDDVFREITDQQTILELKDQIISTLDGMAESMTFKAGGYEIMKVEFYHGEELLVTLLCDTTVRNDIYGHKARLILGSCGLWYNFRNSWELIEPFWEKAAELNGEGST